VAEQVARAAPSEGAGGLEVSLWVQKRGVESVWEWVVGGGCRQDHTGGWTVEA
jgi:hypothetical protein